MTNGSATTFTFHRLRQECEQGAPAAWKAFLEFYSPLFLHLLSLYVPDDTKAASIWSDSLAALSLNNFESFRATARQSEREFLVDIRAVVINAAREQRAKETSETQAVPLNVERVTKILEGLPLAHQEILWFKLAGYADANIERMMRTTPQIASGALGRLEPEFTAAVAPASEGCRWPREWLALLTEAQKAKKEDCPPLHQLLRIQDGQVSWYDKEPMEKRVASCLHCLETWTALREVGYWRRAAPAPPAERLEEWLRALPVDADAVASTPKKKSFLRRVLG